MANQTKEKITVQAEINAPASKVWEYWNEPKHITQWNAAIDTWHCPSAENDLRVGGKLNSRMEAKDGSMGFDFWAIYDVVEPHTHLAYTLGDGRTVDIRLEESNGTTKVTETFEAENENPIEMQRGGWQSILDNFKRYVEGTMVE
ncbi:MAG: SRPBCC family protein [Saprospiraceae bacterium]